MSESAFGWLSLLPPLLSIALAVATRQVVLSLLVGVWAGWVILAGGNVATGTMDTVSALVGVFAEAWQTRVVLFILLMGSLLGLMQYGGGVDGFVRRAGNWRWATNRRGAQVMAWLLGLGVFIESTITCLAVGTVARPLFDRLRISREKLAYIADSTSAPVCMLIPFNGWGALVIGLLGAQAALGNLGEASAMSVFVRAVFLNVYAIGSVLLVLIVCWTGWDFGPMRKAEERARREGKVLRDGARPVVDEALLSQPTKAGVPARMRNMAVPLLVLVGTVIAGIAATGAMGVESQGIADPAWSDFLSEASGSTAVLWGVIAAVLVAGVMLRLQRIFNLGETTDQVLRGAGSMMPLAAIMVLSFAIGMVCNQLGTGPWVAEMAKPWLSPGMIAAVVFVASALIAFSTGTSFGTMAIMMPLAIPLAASYADPALAGAAVVSLPLVVSAVLGGAVFGDHCSPISDTTVVASMAAASDHIDHVRTQLPYALLVAALSIAFYLTAGHLS